mmetsp:Transcript_10434/g.23662  ORF Transcript_10434/g.23662 Transcript_10434/m.23662 type:complete len:366 (+) Transcript_10434:102-1199(+)
MRRQGLIALTCFAYCGLAEMTTAWRNAILRRHNDLRRAQNDPCTATNMLQMTWDENLQAEAAVHSAKCVYEADSRNNNANNLWGENFAMSYTNAEPPQITQNLLLNLVQRWYDEIQDVEWYADFTRVRPMSYANPGVSCSSYDPSSLGCHITFFTAMMEASAGRIGCDVTRCLDGLSPQNTGGVFLVCKYQEQGNIINQLTGQLAPYQVGAICADCPNSCADGLCTSSNNVETCIDELGNGLDFVDVGEQNGGRMTNCVDLLAVNGVTCRALRNNARTQNACSRHCGDCTVNDGNGMDYCGLLPGETTSSTNFFNGSTSTTTTVSEHPCHNWQGGAIARSAPAAAPLPVTFGLIAVATALAMRFR